MDFNALLSVAQKNETAKQTIPCYKTKFTAPKKQSKQSKTLSENIKKFMARKEEEERQKTLEEQRKRENLLALRDHKAQSRINKHLKVCKSANKSVLADAIDNENTAVTMAGPSQPDEDDYGYVSQAAAALYDQLMDKYNKLPPEKPIFSNSEKGTVKDIASTKDRLKQALKQQELGRTDGHRRKRKSSALNEKEIEIDEKAENNVTDKIKDENKDEKPKRKKKSLPSPMNFADLLKIAAKKQHEPVVIEVKPKVEERLMTKRQIQEYTKEKERREQREKNLETNKKPNIESASSKPAKTQSTKISKANEKSTTPNAILNKSSSKVAPIIPKKVADKPNDKSNIQKKSDSSKDLSKNELLEEWKKLKAQRRELEEMRRSIDEEKRKLAQNRSRQEDVKSQVKPSDNKVIAKSKVADKEISSKDIKRQSPTANVKLHSSVANNKPKQFPPPDVRPSKPKRVKKPLASNKRRIYDDEDEYDSDMNDFIDDEEEDNEEDYSKYISEIFHYDKEKYKLLDQQGDVKESDFTQQLKEEYVSMKIGIMEDLEDMRLEALEKKRKALNKKKIRK